MRFTLLCNHVLASACTQSPSTPSPTTPRSVWPASFAALHHLCACRYIIMTTQLHHDNHNRMLLATRSSSMVAPIAFVPLPLRSMSCVHCKR
mmetsp:Transcript_15290/g.26214  ORF Transcript_15290/g.26214 Transcript_15290/m.26214 type:complete len:92 (+) Transcript_15290:238-513(+)